MSLTYDSLNTSLTLTQAGQSSNFFFETRCKTRKSNTPYQSEEQYCGHSPHSTTTYRPQYKPRKRVLRGQFSQPFRQKAGQAGSFALSVLTYRELQERCTLHS